MKRIWQMLMLAVLVAGLIPAGWLFAQHEQHHPQAPAAQPQKAEAPKMCPIAAMMPRQQSMEKLAEALEESFDKVRTLKGSSDRQAAMEEHARLLTELRDSFAQHHAAMAEQMKMCPMMQKPEAETERSKEKK